ncbi:MAG: hypothetical protein JZU60_02065 [Ilumatobacteraceae bacterium]|jgi:hypothetical protein|nr:hypothetical protein [Ilumatobacteraceae bacterium]
MTESTLASLAGILLSVCFSYIPKLQVWYGGLIGQYKRLVMLAALLAVTLGMFALSCAGATAQVACTQEGAKSLIGLFVSALIANQAAYMITPTAAIG